MSALLAVGLVWCILACGSWLAPWIGPEPSILAAQTAAVSFLLATRGRRFRPNPASVAQGLAGICAGCAAFPGFAIATVATGLAVGLAPLPLGTPRGASFAASACLLATAPVFEELLYRERLFDSLRRRCGGGLAVVATSVLFAVPHLEPWQVLGTFLVGVGLGSLRHLGAPVEACIGVHAGLNLAALRWA